MCTHPYEGLTPVTVISCECGALIDGGTAYHPQAPQDLTGVLRNVLSILTATQPVIERAANGKRNTAAALSAERIVRAAVTELTSLLTEERGR